MGIINAECGKTFRIAYQGENKRQQVRFDLADIMGEFPGGTAVLAVLRNGDADPVPAAETEMDGTALIWTVTAWECALEGFLYAQVTYAAGETVAKTKVYRFDVKNSLVVNGAEPEDWQDLVGQLVEAADGVNSAISAAMDTLDEKVAAAEAAQDAAEDAQEAAETARDEAVAAVGQYDDMTAEASGLAAGEEPTAVIDHTGDHPVLQLGIPKGEKGDTGATGQPGPAGPSGVDGFSPTAGVSKVGKIATITIVDKNGTTTASVSDGADGDPGDIIDDTAGAGDTDKTFSADKLTAMDSELKNQITHTEEEIETLVGSMYTETADGGAVVHIENGSDLPFASLITNLDLVQAGSGDAAFDNIRNISPVTGATAYVSETQDAQDAETYPVNWGSTVSTVASGEVDLVKGSMTETWEFVSVLWKNIRTGNVNETTGLEYGLLEFPHAVETVTAQTAYGAKVICNICSTVKWNGAGSTPAHFYIENSKAYIYFPSTTDGEQEIQFAVKLSTPIEHDITGTSIIGKKDCYVWTNTVDVVSVSYVAQMDEFIANTRKTNDTVSEIVDPSLVMENAVPFGFATANGEDSISATTYWNTGLVHIPDNSSVLKANATIYKTAFYDASRTFISCNNTNNENIPIPANTKYAKVQISNSVISFANRGTLRISCDATELTKVSNYAIPGLFSGRFEYEGERIVTKPLYETYPLIASASCQAGCVYGDSLFRFKTDGTFLVYDLTTRAKIADGSGIVVGGLYPHCNTACFGEKYDSSDPYPLLYVNAYNTEGMPKGTCYVFRISVSGATMTASLIQTITVGFVEDAIWKSGEDIRPYGNFCVDVRNKTLFVYTLRDTGSVTRFFRFDLPATSNATVTLAQSDIVEYWDTDYYPYIQDNACAYGKIYLCSGYGGSSSNPGMIHVIDTIQRKETSRINLYKNGMQSEPEILDFYNGDLICGDSGIYRFIF